MHIFAVSRRQELKHKSALTGGVISGAAGQNRSARAEGKAFLGISHPEKSHWRLPKKFLIFISGDLIRRYRLNI